MAKQIPCFDFLCPSLPTLLAQKVEGGECGRMRKDSVEVEMGEGMRKWMNRAGPRTKAQCPVHDLVHSPDSCFCTVPDKHICWPVHVIG